MKQFKQYEKIKTFQQNTGYYIWYSVCDQCINVYLFNKFIRMKQRQKEIDDFLSSRRGLAYLSMKYPRLTVEEAIKEYKISASKQTNKAI